MRLASDIEVPGEGDPASKIWLIGESPGETEVKERRPFVGMAGKVLDGILQEAGISRAECYIDNLVRFRPRDNKFEEFYETSGSNGSKTKTPSKLLTESLQRLQESAATHRPSVIVALGTEPMQLLGGEDYPGGISSWRGSVLQTRSGIKLIPTFHPSYLLRAWSDRPLAVFDLRRAKAESWFPEIRRKKREIALNLSFKETERVLNDILENSQAVAFDIETEGNTEISSIAIADSPEFAVVVPIQFRGREHWSASEREALKSIIRSILESPGIQKIAQNAQYDMIWLEDKWGIKVSPLYMDTLVAHSLLMPEYQKSLAFQCSIYTDIPYYKHERKTLDADTYFRYNGTDALATFDCALEIQEQLEEDGLWDFYRNLPHKLLEPLRELSLRGLKVDRDLREGMRKETEAETQKLTEIIREDATCHEFEKTCLRKGAEAKIIKKWEESRDKMVQSGKRSKASIAVKFPTPEEYIKSREEAGDLPSFNPNSSAQLVQYLYTYRGWKPILNPRSDGKRTPTSDQSALRKLLSQHPEESILQAFLDLGDLTKELEFLRAKLEKDGRLHCTYDITGTETGRISSKKYVYDTGANLQNQPAGKRKQSVLRRVFIPDDGKVFLQRDLKQAEAWVVAYLCEDPFFMDAIRSSDIHKRTASLIFRKPEGEVTKRERELAKRCVHALNYGMGYIKFSEQIGVSQVEARDLRNRYFAAFPRLGMWHSEIKLKLARDRELVTPFGRRRQFTAGWNEDLWKEAWAYLPQSTVGDLLNTGFIEFWEWLKSPLHQTTISHELAKMSLQNKVGSFIHCSNEQFYDCQIMLQIHDSLVVQCPEKHVPVIASKLKSCLERPIQIGRHTITIPTDCSVGPNWLDLKEIEE